ncbi:MAG: hypothetical protein GVY15_09025 [Bacteroidetes bacterium]|nr:hypothetical protein [Bacteroidota bacterium]
MPRLLTVGFVAALLLSACASTEPTTDTAQQPPSEPTLADNIWWNGLEGEDVYSTAETMPKPVGGMRAVVEQTRERLTGLGCEANHTHARVLVVISAAGEVIDTTIGGEAKGDACERMMRLAAFDLEWEPATVSNEPVHAVMGYRFSLR